MRTNLRIELLSGVNPKLYCGSINYANEEVESLLVYSVSKYGIDLVGCGEVKNFQSDVFIFDSDSGSGEIEFDLSQEDLAFGHVEGNVGFGGIIVRQDYFQTDSALVVDQVRSLILEVDQVRSDIGDVCSTTVFDQSDTPFRMYYGGFVLGNSGRELSYVDISKDPELSV
ncbi:MAG: hypothetical protein EZS28_024083 [Streblomastix strix]|uniref:Uncharacterized protein n=1 Tax=Streblomastix strix TaxID=222440 RepID=A0A5J4VCX5_9EUKA|nr:MAG: hypothetical protein EZS28_024083 [Streblomastix strix]